MSRHAGAIGGGLRKPGLPRWWGDRLTNPSAGLSARFCWLRWRKRLPSLHRLPFQRPWAARPGSRRDIGNGISGCAARRLAVGKFYTRSSEIR